MSEDVEVKWMDVVRRMAAEDNMGLARTGNQPLVSASRAETVSKQDQLDAMVSAFEAREQEFRDCNDRLGATLAHLTSKMAQMERELQGSYAFRAYGLKLDQEPLCLAVLSGLQRIAPEHNGIIGTDELYELRDKVRDLLERVRLRDAKEEVLLEVPF